MTQTKTIEETPKIEAETPPLDTRRYLPRAFGILIDIPGTDQSAYLEGTFFAVQERGNAIDAAGTVRLPNQDLIAFENLVELAKVTKWSQESMNGVIQRFQKLIS